MRAGIPGLKFPVAAQLGGGAATPHHVTHQTGGTDALAGTIDANARTLVSLDGTDIGTRRRIAFKTGLAGGPSATDDNTNEQVVVNLPTRAPASRITSVANSFSSGSKLFASAAHNGVPGAVVLGAVTTYMYPFWWPWGYTPATVGMEVAAAVASAKLKLAMFTMGADYSIGSRLFITGDFDASTTGVKSAAITFDGGAVWPGPGLLWFGLNSDSAISVRGQASVYGLNLLPYKSAGGTTAIPGLLAVAQAYATAMASPPAITALLASALGCPYGLLGP